VGKRFLPMLYGEPENDRRSVIAARHRDFQPLDLSFAAFGHLPRFSALDYRKLFRSKQFRSMIKCCYTHATFPTIQ
jgi:hypothetical protein